MMFLRKKFAVYFDSPVVEGHFPTQAEIDAYEKKMTEARRLLAEVGAVYQEDGVEFEIRAEPVYRSISHK